jgi:hypothetical protein
LIAKGVISPTNEYQRKLKPATFTPVLTTSAVVLIVFPVLFRTFIVLVVAVADFASHFSPALAAFPAPKVKSPATSSTTEAPHAIPLIHLSVLDNSPAIPSPVIEVHTS